MQQNTPKCSKCVGENKTIKYGKTKTGKQRYKCKGCNKTQIAEYTNQAYQQTTNTWITKLVKEGSGIRSIARLLSISNTTVLKRIKQIAEKISKPIIAYNKEYEVDELCTYYKRKTKQLWIAYALRKDNKEVTTFTVGSRTNSTLQKITDTLILSHATAIHTDKLKIYKNLLPAAIHKTKAYNINHIERKNLSLRTHLKRLNRKTICYTKSITILTACLKIYFWSDQ